ncbi:DUF4396 domain-containing protein [Salinisphaera sp. LB1]|uniref:DUF4396 domain-containing protein n=1 Tax=Salinisphaera sp. LB1 TaxID=2183911 RepID=UPI000D7058B8|nr:DUF4396 domain-containing protein [Salinisphaera sp. LB1]
MGVLEIVAWIVVLLGVATGLAILRDVIRHPQPMQIMNVTWPVNGLFTPVFGWWVYKKLGRPDADAGGHTHKPFPQSVLVGVTHCAGGCVLGDSIAAPIVSIVGLTVAGSLLLGHFAGEFVAAYLFGIAFQMLPMMSMGESNPFKAFINAIKADTLSLVSFEIGMFGFIALSFLVLLPHEPEVTSPVFWFMMQIAMIIGFATAYPANWWLIKRGIKHGM